MTSRKSKYILELKWFLFTVPAILFYLLFFIVPSGTSAYYSLTDWNGLDFKFIGFDNYIKMFSDDKVLIAFKNTIFYAITITILQNSLGLLLALLMNKKMKSINMLRTLFFMPAVFSSLVLGFVWGYMLEPNIGVVNSIFGALKMPFLQLDWLGNPRIGIWMIVFVTVWQFVGYSMVIYLAGLQSIPNELFEAGDIDGAHGFKKFTSITFPLIAPSLTLNVMLTTIGCLKLFDQIFAMTKGGPGYSTQSVATIIYTLGFGANSEWGYGTAMSIVLFGFILILTSIQVTLLRKREVEL